MPPKTYHFVIDEDEDLDTEFDSFDRQVEMNGIIADISYRIADDIMKAVSPNSSKEAINKAQTVKKAIASHIAGVLIDNHVKEKYEQMLDNALSPEDVKTEADMFIKGGNRVPSFISDKIFVDAVSEACDVENIRGAIEFANMGREEPDEFTQNFRGYHGEAEFSDDRMRVVTGDDLGLSPLAIDIAMKYQRNSPELVTKPSPEATDDMKIQAEKKHLEYLEKVQKAEEQTRKQTIDSYKKQIKKAQTREEKRALRKTLSEVKSTYRKTDRDMKRRRKANLRESKARLRELETVRKARLKAEARLKKEEEKRRQEAAKREKARQKAAEKNNSTLKQNLLQEEVTAEKTAGTRKQISKEQSLQLKEKSTTSSNLTSPDPLAKSESKTAEKTAEKTDTPKLGG